MDDKRVDLAGGCIGNRALRSLRRHPEREAVVSALQHEGVQLFARIGRALRRHEYLGLVNGQNRPRHMVSELSLEAALRDFVRTMQPESPEYLTSVHAVGTKLPYKHGGQDGAEGGRQPSKAHDGEHTFSDEGRERCSG